MNKYYSKMVALFLIITMPANLAGCGSESTNTAAELVEEEFDLAEAVESETEVIDKEENDTGISYVEKYSLEFCKNTSAETTGVLCLADQTDNADIIDTTWHLDDIYTIEESGKQTITIIQHTDGYFWGNGKDVFKTNLMLPSGKIYDVYTGTMIPASAEEIVEETTVEWDDKKYTITNNETYEWKNADWSEWTEDPNGGERLKSTLYVTNKITVDAVDYDGLALLLQPITDFSGSLDGAYIADVWTDDCYLFNISGMAETFKLARMEVESTETEEVPVEEEEKTETKPKPESKPVTPAHKHNYKGFVTANATCSSTGTKTFTCSCGDSYIESIGTTAHDFSVPVTQTVWHDEVWKTVPREVKTVWIYCRICKKNYYSNEDYQAHFSWCSSTGSGFDVFTKTETVYDREKVSDGYFEDVIVGYKCSVCGTQK